MAAVTALGLAAGSAWGLGLGKLSVQSALGETLRAEIDISSLSAEEAASLKLRVAPPDAYRSSGLDYDSVLASVHVQLARRADGRPYLRLSSDRAVQEPFVDVILELNWSSGRLVREFTLLFDPPPSNRTEARPAEPSTSPLISAAPTPQPSASIAPPASTASTVEAPASRPRAEAPRPAAPPVAPPPAPLPPPVAVTAKPKPAPSAAPTPAPAPVAAAPASAPGQYTVKSGDTLYRVAAKTQPGGVSLEQMLVGLYRNNPDAFINSNMNRLKSGAVLQVPGADAASSVSRAEARQIIQAQSTDFGAYRERLADAAPALKSEGDRQQAKGKVQAAVEDRKPAAAATPDKLTLSKSASASGESKVSKDTEKKDSATRVAELTRNVEELKRLSAAAKPGSAAPVTAAPAPASSPVTPVTVAAAPSVPPVAPPVASAPAQPAASAPAPAASRPAPAPVVVPEPTPEPGLLDTLGEFAIPLGAALLALLGGLGYKRWRDRKAAAGRDDTAFSESRLQPDSFFGASGGQRVDTRDGGSTSGQSSMSYSLSQLDAIGDVDPVAEADVYLAYGRDLQAEEILKEALRANPERLAIRLKLLEVYAKRRDIKGFEQLAIQLFAETQGQGEDWAKVQELGRQVDPDNPLYQPGGAPITLSGEDEQRPEPMNASTLPAAPHLMTAPLARASAPAADPGPSSLMDLDLDLDLGSTPPPAPAMQATQALATSVNQAPLSMDLDLDVPSLAVPPPAPAPTGASDLEFSLDDFDLPATPASAPQAGGANALDFDLSSIDLDLPETPAPVPAGTVTDSDKTLDELADEIAEQTTELDSGLPANFDTQLEPATVTPPDTLSLDDLGVDLDSIDPNDDEALQRQLELAEEFRQIGDAEGARDVLQEVVDKASGPLRDKAQALLNQMR